MKEMVKREAAELLAKRQQLVKETQAARKKSAVDGNSKRMSLKNKAKIGSFVAKRGSVDLGYLVDPFWKVTYY